MTTEMQPAAPESASRQQRILGLTGQGAGIVGIVICLLLILGVLYARGWAIDSVTGISTRADTAIGKGIPLLDSATAKVTDAAGRVGAVADAATEVAAVASPGSAVIDRLSGQLSGLSERYLALRADYANAHASVTSLLDQLQTLDRLVPFIEIPQGPIDALAALDGKIQDLDAKVMDLLNASQGTGVISTAAGAIAEKATGIETRLSTVASDLTAASAKLQDLRTELAATTDTVTTGITVFTIVMIALLLYLTVLHVVLYRSAKRYRRPADG